MGHENDSPRENHLCVNSQYLFKDIYNCCAYPFRGEARVIAAKHTLYLKLRSLKSLLPNKTTFGPDGQRVTFKCKKSLQRS